MIYKFKKMAAIAVAACSMLTGVAHADYVFSGSGNSGALNAGGAWSFNFSGQNNWGSPGVGAGITAYTGTESAFGFDITFSGGGSILPGSIALGNVSACQGSATGGTTLCSTPFTSADIWKAFEIDSTTVSFRAQDASLILNTGDTYFVNIFFQGDTPTSFSGRWLTSFEPDPTRVPEPASLALFGLALAGLAATKRRKN